MTDTAFPPLDVTAQWGRLNDGLATLVDYVPEDQMDWSPREGLWNFREILLHTVRARDYWMGPVVRDGEQAPSAPETAQSKEEIQRELHRSWERVQRFLAKREKLSNEYETQRGSVAGHWIAFHLLEHDIHHRADIFHYLALLGIEHPQVGTP